MAATRRQAPQAGERFARIRPRRGGQHILPRPPVRQGSTTPVRGGETGEGQGRGSVAGIRRKTGDIRVVSADAGEMEGGRTGSARVLDDPRSEGARRLADVSRQVVTRRCPSRAKAVRQGRTVARRGLRGIEEARGEDSSREPPQPPADRGPGATGSTVRRLGEAERRGEVAQVSGCSQAGGEDAREVEIQVSSRRAQPGRLTASDATLGEKTAGGA